MEYIIIIGIVIVVIIMLFGVWMIFWKLVDVVFLFEFVLYIDVDS